MVDPIELSESVAFSVEFGATEQDRPVGFDTHGIRRNYSSEDEDELESIDVIFAAMEPGERKGFDITEPFLQTVARNFSDPVPMQLDHDENQLSNVGTINAARFSDGFLRLIGNVPNTGNSIKSDVIADFTHDPPAIRDGSVGFGSDIVIQQNEEGNPEFVDANIIEFSLTPFPAGYDDRGGLSPQFRKAARDAGVFSEELVERDWGEGDVVQWQAVSSMIGAVSHIDERRMVAMVGLHNERGSELIPTGYTVTAGFDDVVPYGGSAEPVAAEDLEEMDYSQLRVSESQITE